jgi:hypothetical protein
VKYETRELLVSSDVQCGEIKFPDSYTVCWLGESHRSLMLHELSKLTMSSVGQGNIIIKRIIVLAVSALLHDHRLNIKLSVVLRTVYALKETCHYVISLRLGASKSIPKERNCHL